MSRAHLSMRSFRMFKFTPTSSSPSVMATPNIAFTELGSHSAVDAAQPVLSNPLPPAVTEYSPDFRLGYYHNYYGHPAAFYPPYPPIMAVPPHEAGGGYVVGSEIAAPSLPAQRAPAAPLSFFNLGYERNKKAYDDPDFIPGSTPSTGESSYEEEAARRRQRNNEAVRRCRERKRQKEEAKRAGEESGLNPKEANDTTANIASAPSKQIRHAAPSKKVQDDDAQENIKLINENAALRIRIIELETELRNLKEEEHPGEHAAPSLN